jgi:Fur family iron response transcriptional regulator
MNAESETAEMTEELSRTADAGRDAPAKMDDRAKSNLRGRLIAAGIRPTRQRVSLGGLLFSKGDRHVTAERLFEEATAAKLQVSLATVYNTLHQFTAVGLLREIAVDGARVYFDTNTSEHHHFLIEDGDGLYDIPGSQIDVSNLPTPPSGMKVSRIDVVVRLRKDGA